MSRERKETNCKHFTNHWHCMKEGADPKKQCPWYNNAWDKEKFCPFFKQQTCEICGGRNMWTDWQNENGRHYICYNCRLEFCHTKELGKHIIDNRKTIKNKHGKEVVNINYRKIIQKEFIDKNYLIENPNHIFVFGDNLLRKGYGGCAKLRDFKNTYGFITKKKPDNINTSFYKPEEYSEVYKLEIQKLIKFIVDNPEKLFVISRLGSGLANKYKIFEKIINPNIKHKLSMLKNVKFFW